MQPKSKFKTTEECSFTSTMLDFSNEHSAEKIMSRHRGEGGAGGAIAPPVFVANIYKRIKLEAKEVNILKILTSDLYRRCMRHIVRVIHHVNLICSLGRRHFQHSKLMLRALWDSKKFAVDFVTAVIALLNQLRSHFIA